MKKGARKDAARQERAVVQLEYGYFYGKRSPEGRT